MFIHIRNIPPYKWLWCWMKGADSPAGNESRAHTELLTSSHSRMRHDLTVRVCLSTSIIEQTRNLRFTRLDFLISNRSINLQCNAEIEFHESPNQIHSPSWSPLGQPKIYVNWTVNNGKPITTSINLISSLHYATILTCCAKIWIIDRNLKGHTEHC